MRWARLRRLVGRTARAWNDHNAARLAAALAYYSVFSAAPLLLLSVALGSLIFGAEAARGQLLGRLEGVVGAELAAAIEQLLRDTHQVSGGRTATAVAFVVMLLGASGVFVELQGALNTIWEVPPGKRPGLVALVRGRVLSYAVVLLTGVLLVGELALSVALTAALHYAGADLPPAWLSRGLNLALALALVTALFALIYKLLPDAPVRWREAWAGAVVTALLYTVGKDGLSVYLARGTLVSAFGAAGSVILVLTWVYYSAMVFLFGAELTRALGKEEPS